MIGRLAIIGVGLIGGSLARALRRAGYCDQIIGYGRSAVNLDRAVELGVIDRACAELGEAVADADMIVVAVPLGATESTLRAIAAAAPATAVITDVGSSKGAVIAAAAAAFGGSSPRFIPGHPIAGGEYSGVEASRVELFEQHKVILTPEPSADPAALAAVREMWRAAGATVVEMDAGHHDKLLAATSHLPHMLAFSLVAMLSRLDSEAEIFEFAAGGFRDFTRIASSDPVMWRDICLANRGELTGMIDGFIEQLAEIRTAVASGDGAALQSEFAFAKAERDRFIQADHKQ